MINPVFNTMGKSLPEKASHEFFMRAALTLAEQAGLDGERPIGAVIVCKGKIVGEGHANHNSRHSEIAHAELNALLEAEKTISAHIHDNVILYSTVEPCVMCLGAVVMSDVDHIIFGAYDINIHPEKMLEIPYVKRHILTYQGGILAQQSLDLFRRFRENDLWYLSDKNE
jgi:tRNA(adenine34) deaminase